jgi:hypothetical protein
MDGEWPRRIVAMICDPPGIHANVWPRQPRGLANRVVPRCIANYDPAVLLINSGHELQISAG